MDRKLLLRIVSIVALLFGMGFIGSSMIGYWEYSTYGIFIDLEDRLALVMSSIAGISISVFALFLPLLFKKWATTNEEIADEERKLS